MTIIDRNHTQDTTVLDGQSIDIINNAVLGNTPLVTYKTSPWDIDKLEQYAEINLAPEIAETDGISFGEDGPQLVSRDDIVPVNWGETEQVRVGIALDYLYIARLKDDIGRAWGYSTKLPVVEKLKKPIKKTKGKGYYHYRIVDARHRFEATMEYKDFPCYIVEGHEADIGLLGTKLNNPSTTDKKRELTDDDVQSQIQKQVKWYEKTAGEKGCKPTVDNVVDFLKEHFPYTKPLDTKRFAIKCLEAEGIKQALEDPNAAQISMVIKQYHPTRTTGGNVDSKDRVGHIIRFGRTIDELSAHYAMGKSQIEEWYLHGKVRDHYFIGVMSQGAGVSPAPTTQNLDTLRKNNEGSFMKHVREYCIPLADMFSDEAIKSPEVKFVAQNNGKGESPDKLY
jgi:hypothetical protein